MDINEFASYCMDNAANIYIVEIWTINGYHFEKIVSLAEAGNKSYQMHKLWRGRFAQEYPKTWSGSYKI